MRIAFVPIIYSPKYMAKLTVYRREIDTRVYLLLVEDVKTSNVEFLYVALRRF